MAMKIKWDVGMDGAIAVAGASILDQYVVQNVQAIADMLANLPADMMGISVKAVLLGAAALITYKTFAK